jgi:peptidoglycan/xylan/chitin deacetylase (PgdA/CDA1 family)
VKEKLFRNVLTNVVIAVVVLSVFGITYLSVETPVRSNPDGAINRGNSTDKVSLMFNVYNGTEYIDDILKVLDTYKIVTTFFVGGSWVSNNEETLQRISHYGHELGNHGYFRQDHSTISAQRNREEIMATHKLVQAILNINMTNFAPPFGVYGKHTIQEASNLGYNTIMWSIDSLDQRDGDPNLILKRATERVSAGDFVLLHPTQATLQALPNIIQAIKTKGLLVAPVRELI